MQSIHIDFTMLRIWRLNICFSHRSTAQIWRPWKFICWRHVAYLLINTSSSRRNKLGVNFTGFRIGRLILQDAQRLSRYLIRKWQLEYSTGVFILIRLTNIAIKEWYCFDFLLCKYYYSVYCTYLERKKIMVNLMIDIIHSERN